LYVVFVLIGALVSVGVGYYVEKEISSTVSLVVFLTMFFANFAVSWIAVILAIGGNLKNVHGEPDERACRLARVPAGGFRSLDIGAHGLAGSVGKATRKKMPRLERGSFARPRSHQTRVCTTGRTMRRGVHNRSSPRAGPTFNFAPHPFSFEVADDFASVRGDSVKAPSPFGGALRKTSRCGERRTLPPAPQSAVGCETDGALWITSRVVSAGRVRIGGGSIRSKCSNRAEAPRFRPPQSPTPMEVKSGASFSLPIIS
jgi:hypothetical protein